jgi:uncharacterized protein (TIGR04255 family)
MARQWSNRRSNVSSPNDYAHAFAQDSATRSRRLNPPNTCHDVASDRVMNRQVGPPKFTAPPVSEVAVAIYFPALEGVNHFELAHLHELWRADFPKTEEHPTAPPVEIEAENALAMNIAMNIRFAFISDGGAASWPRSWFVAESGDRLIQLQRDRVVVNWRRTDASQPYPHYSQLRADIQRIAADVGDLVLRSTGAELRPSQVEVTYVNPIRTGSGSSLSDWLRSWSGDRSTGFLPDPEDVRVAMRYRIVDDREAWRGRLYVMVEPTPTADDDDDQVVMQVFARVALPADGGLAEALGALDLAHEWVVKGFHDVTTVKAHELWGADK